MLTQIASITFKGVPPFKLGVVFRVLVLIPVLVPVLVFFVVVISYVQRSRHRLD